MNSNPIPSKYRGVKPVYSLIAVIAFAIGFVAGSLMGYRNGYQAATSVTSQATPAPPLYVWTAAAHPEMTLVIGSVAAADSTSPGTKPPIAYLCKRGGTVTQLAIPEGTAWVNSPVVSEDGKKLAAECQIGDSNEVAIWDLAAGDLRTITNDTEDSVSGQEAGWYQQRAETTEVAGRPSVNVEDRTITITYRDGSTGKWIIP